MEGQERTEFLCPRIIPIFLPHSRPRSNLSLFLFSRFSLGITPLIGNFRVKAKLRLRFDPERIA